MATLLSNATNGVCSSLIDLPADVLIHILFFGDANEFISIRQSGRHFHILIKSRHTMLNDFWKRKALNLSMNTDNSRRSDIIGNDWVLYYRELNMVNDYFEQLINNEIEIHKTLITKQELNEIKGKDMEKERLKSEINSMAQQIVYNKTKENRYKLGINAKLLRYAVCYHLPFAFEYILSFELINFNMLNECILMPCMLLKPKRDELILRSMLNDSRFEMNHLNQGYNWEITDRINEPFSIIFGQREALWINTYVNDIYKCSAVCDNGQTKNFIIDSYECESIAYQFIDPITHSMSCIMSCVLFNNWTPFDVLLYQIDRNIKGNINDLDLWLLKQRVDRIRTGNTINTRAIYDSGIVGNKKDKAFNTDESRDYELGLDAFISEMMSYLYGKPYDNDNNKINNIAINWNEINDCSKSFRERGINTISNNNNSTINDKNNRKFIKLVKRSIKLMVEKGVSFVNENQRIFDKKRSKKLNCPNSHFEYACLYDKPNLVNILIYLIRKFLLPASIITKGRKNEDSITITTTPLHMACAMNSYQVTEIIVKHMFDRARNIIWSNNCNHYYNNQETMEFYNKAMNKAKKCLNMKNSKDDVEGETPLIISMKNKAYQCMKILMKYEIDANVTFGENDKTAVCLACEMGDLKALQILLTPTECNNNNNNNRANIFKKDKNGKTALMYAAINSDFIMIEYIYNYLKNIEKYDSHFIIDFINAKERINGNTAFIMACQKYNENCKGDNNNTDNKYKNTLYVLVKVCNVDTSIKNNYGETGSKIIMPNMKIEAIEDMQYQLMPNQSENMPMYSRYWKWRQEQEMMQISK